MLIANFKEGVLVAYAYGQWQHNYGQILQIEGLDLPTGTQVHFSLSETGGEAIPMVAVREGDVLKAEVPGQLLKNEEALSDFSIYAYVYTSDDSSGQTIRKIIIPVEARPDIGAEVSEEEPNPFDLVVQQIKALVAAAAEETANQIIAELNLTEYVKNTDYATEERAGLARFNSTYGLAVNQNNGIVSLQKATTAQIDAKEENFRCITPSLIDYAVKKALSDCKLADDDVWSDDEKLAAANLLNVLSLSKLGTGLRVDSLGNLQINGGLITENMISKKLVNQAAITPSTVDLAVKYGLADSQIEWTDEEKASARGLLNVVATEKETTTYMSADFEGIDSSALTEEELANALSNIGVGSITATNTAVLIADGVLSIASSAKIRTVDIFTKDTVPEDGTLNVSLKVDYTSTLKTDVYIVQYTEDISTELVSDSVPCIVSEDGLWGEYNATIPRETGYPLVAVRIKAPRTYRTAMTIDDVFVVYEKATGYLKDESGQTFIPSTVAEKVKVDEDTDIKEYVDGLFKEYVDDIAELVGGDA